MKNKILIFTATYNEADNIGEWIERIDKLNLNADILIIDDNSPDKTWKIIQEYSQKKNIELMIREKKEGLNTAHHLAYEYSIKNNYDLLITMDADLSHDPNSIPLFLNELKTNDFVIGSRYISSGKSELKGIRFFISYYGNKFIKFIFSINCHEFTTSFRGYNLKNLKNFHLKNVQSKGYSFFMETMYLINSKGFEFKEIPIHFKDRQKGKSKIQKIEIIRTLYNVFRLKLENLF